MGAADGRARALESMRAQRDQGTAAPSAAAIGRQRALGELTGDTGEEDGGGLWQLPKGLFEATQAVPAGIVGMAGDTIDTLHNTARILPTAFVKGVGAARGQSAEDVARIAEESPLGLGQAFISPDMLRGVPGDPAAQEGLGKWIDENTPLASGEFSALGHELFPLPAAMGASFAKTVERGTDFAAAGNPVGVLSDISQGKDPLKDLADTKYVEAWNKGEIVPVALEDVANVSMFAAGGGAAAGRIAGSAGKRAVALETEMSAAAARGGASDASIAARAARARGVESAAAGAEAGFNKVAHLTGRAGDLPATMWKAPGILGKTAGGRFGLFRAGAPAAGLAEKLIPFGAEGTRTGLVGMMRERGMESLVDNLDRSPTGERLVNWVDDHPVAAVRNQMMKSEVLNDLRNLDAEAADARKGVAQGGVLANRAAKQAARALGADADTVGAAATMAAAKAPESIAAILDDPAKMQIATDELAAAGVIVDADPVIAREQIAAAVFGPQNVEAFKIASQFSRGQMDPAGAVWFQRITDRMNTSMRDPRGEAYAIAQDEARLPTPETLAARKEQLGDEPMPSVVEKAVAPAQQRVEKRRKEVEQANKLADAAFAKRLDDDFNRPARDIAAEVAPTVSDAALRPIERAAQQQGIEGYAQDRARALTERSLYPPDLEQTIAKAQAEQDAARAAGLPVDDVDVAEVLRKANGPASAAEVAQGVRRDVRAADGLTAAGRRLREATDTADQVLDETGRAALPKDASLFESGAAAERARTLPPRERARADVDEIVGPRGGPRTGPKSSARKRLAEVKAAAAERVRLARRDVEVESASLFGTDVPPTLPFIPPRLVSPRLDAKGRLTRNWLKDTPEFWEGVRDPEGFAKAFMAPEPWDMHKLRMAIEIREHKRTGHDFFEDGADLRKEYDRLVEAGDPPHLETEIGSRTGVEHAGYRHNQAYIDIAERHAQGHGLESGEARASSSGLVDDQAWLDDYQRLAEEHKWLSDAEADLTSPPGGGGRRARNEAADRLYQAGHMADLAEMTEVAPGVEIPSITQAELAAALDQGYVPMKTRGGKTVHRAYNQAERDGLMAKAIDERRVELEQTLHETYQRQVDQAFSHDFYGKPPWEMSRADYLAEVADAESVAQELIDAAAPGDDITAALAEVDALVPEGFAGSLDEVHDQWLHRADERGLQRAPDDSPTVVTPDQLADQAIAGTLAKVTDAFDADGGVKGAGFASLSKKERAVYRRMEAAAREADAASVVADTRAAVSDLQARHRQGIVDDTLDRQALRFGADAERAGKRAGDVYGARLKSIENTVRQVVKDQRKIGVKEGEFRVRQRDLDKKLRQLNRDEAALARAYQEARRSPEATPARFTEGIRARSKTAEFLGGAADRLDEQAPGTGDLLRSLIPDIEAVDAYTLADVMGDPTHIISGQKGAGGKSTAAGRMNDRPFISESGTSKQKRRRAGQSEYGIRQQTALEAGRLTVHMRNRAARFMTEKWGRTAAQVTAELDRGRRGGPDLRGLEGLELAKAADEAGYVAWDPESFKDTVPRAAYTQETILVPKIMMEATDKALNPNSSFMKGIEKWYDRRFMGQIKMFWLALSPRWLTANVVGNAVMGMVGAGIAPWDYAYHLGNARALLAEDAPVEWETGNRLQRRAFERRQRLVAKGDSLRLQGYEMPSQALNRGFTHEELPFLMGDDLTGPRSPVRKLAARSYQANEYVDNLNRATIYLAKAEPRRALHEAWENGEISDVDFFDRLAKTRTGEQALAQANRAAGDFAKMSTFERSVVKRIIPFYPWYRHITKLAMSMPIYAPARTVWLLHLADVFGGDPDEERGAGKGIALQDSLPGFAKGSIPLPGGGLLSSAGMNPFESGIESPFFSLEGMLGATTPAFQWPMALVFGKDAKHGLRDFTRPPGDGNLDEYGRPANTPLAQEPGEAARYLGMQLPQGRLFSTAVEEPVLRYGNGDEMISGGQFIPSGRPSGLTGVALGALGVPTPMNVESEEIAARTAKRRSEQAKKRKRYESQRERLKAG